MVEPRPLPPREARTFWTDKRVVTGREFDELSDQARARSFAVSGISARDQLEQVHAAMASALEGGETLADFKSRIRGILERKGWTGKRAWRVDTIFRTNIQSAYQAGRLVQMRRAAASRPLWRYVAVADRRTRPTHLALHGMVYPHDHPFWETYYPPNGFRCRCTVQSLSHRQAEARGLEVQSDLPELVEPVDPQTGRRLPPLRPVPDKGFAQNPGEDWLAELTPTEIDERDLRLLPVKAICRNGVSLASEGNDCKPRLSEIDPRHVLKVNPEDILHGKDKERHVLAFLGEFGLKSLDDWTIHTLPGGYVVPISKWFFMEKASGQLKGTWTDKGPYLRLLARTILNPYEVWLSEVELKRGATKSLRCIRPYSLDGKTIGGYCAWHLNWDTTWAAATAFSPKAKRSQRAILEYLENMRVGTLIYRAELK